jgi:hypothetical protein
MGVVSMAVCVCMVGRVGVAVTVGLRWMSFSLWLVDSSWLVKKRTPKAGLAEVYQRRCHVDWCHCGCLWAVVVVACGRLD